MSADKQLAAYVDRVLRMKEEADGIAEDVKAIYAEAKNEGYDKTQLGNLVTYLRKRAKDKDGEAEKEAVFDLYLSAYLRAKGEVGTDRATRTHAPDDEISEPQSVPPAARDLTTSHAPSGQVAPIQPETANEASDDNGHVAADAAGHGQVEAKAETQPTGGENVATASAHIGTGEGAHNASVTTFIPKPLRPYCLNPGTKCGGQAKRHCWSCQKAHDDKQGVA